MRRNLFRIQWRFLLVMLRTLLASKVDYYLGTFSLLVLQASSLIFLFLAFSRREQLAGYSRDEVLLFFAVSFAVQALTQCFCEGLWLVGPKYVLKGELDYLLVRPLSPLIQIVMAHLHSSGVLPLALGAALIFQTLGRLRPDPSVLDFALVYYNVFVGFVVQFSLLLAIASLSFRHGKVTALAGMLTTLQQFLAYPLDIFPRFVILLFTFVVPLAFASYFPVLEAIRKPGSGSFHPLWFSLQMTVLGFVCLLAGLHCWKRGVMRYQSSQG